MARPAPAQTLPDEDIDSLLRAAEQRLSQQAAPESTAAPDEAAPESAMAKKKKSSDSSLSSATATTTPKHESADVSVRVPHLKKAKGQQSKANAGPNWFNLPKTDLTPELKRDLQLLKMRDILSGGKRHYKKSGSGPAAPAYSQVGIIKDATAPQTSRRNPTGGSLMQGVLQNDNQTRYFKRKYGEIQTEKMSGKKAWYKGVVQKRKGGK